MLGHNLLSTHEDSKVRVNIAPPRPPPPPKGEGASFACTGSSNRVDRVLTRLGQGRLYGGVWLALQTTKKNK